MHTLTRYVLFDFLKILLVALLSMTALIMLVGVGREAVREGLGLRPLLQLTPYLVPFALRFAVPGTVLLAATVVLGRMASTNEIVALKSLGISPMAILSPLFALAFAISLAAVWLNDLAISWGQHGVLRVIRESAEETAYSILRTQRTYITRRIAIHVDQVDGRKLIQPTITLKPIDGRPGGTISAEEAQLRADLENGELRIELFNAMVDFGRYKAFWPDRTQYVIPLGDFSRKGDAPARPSEVPLGSISAEIHRNQEIIAHLQQSGAIAATLQLATGDFSALMDESWRRRQQSIANARVALTRLRTEPHRRWANGFSCLCFAVVGAPMAIRRRHGDLLASFFVCFLPILVVYYPFLMLSVQYAKEGNWPPQSVWLGNVVLAAWGIWLLRRVLRY
jgi:lipopolysaccharide export system permease protein